MANIISKIYKFYYEGFRTLTPTSKKLWAIIAIKLFVMFAVLKLFFFPNTIKNRSNEQNITKEEFVGQELINRKAK